MAGMKRVVIAIAQDEYTGRRIGTVREETLTAAEEQARAAEAAAWSAGRDAAEARQLLAASDAALARGVEDLLARQDALVMALAKAGIDLAGVPDVAAALRSRIAARAAARATLAAQEGSR